MHVRVRMFGKPDTLVVVDSKLTKIDTFRGLLKKKFGVEPKSQRLFYGGKLLEDGYTFHDYSIKLNDVIQLMAVTAPDPQYTKNEDTNETEKNEQDKEDEDKKPKIVYEDANSSLYAVGDYVDMRDRELGAWLEGKIARIVLDNTQKNLTHSIDNSQDDCDVENRPPSKINESKNRSSAKKLSVQYRNSVDDDKLLYAIELDGEDEYEYCKLKEIRPRARTVIEVKDLKEGQKVMLNHNMDSPNERGHWYDFKVSEVKKLRTSYELIGTLYMGPDAVPQNDTQLKVIDKIYAIEEVVPIAERSEEYNKTIRSPPEKRSSPVLCLTCRDDDDVLCKDCGCYKCLGKENPEKIILCDECNKGFHLDCLTPPMDSIPDDDWYCPDCKRDPNDVIAPGASKQTKKTNTKTTRDWGRGMACVGKTKTCAMPANHFGPIPGIEVGMCWRFRIQLSESGVHRPPVSGIHGRDVEGAYSIVLSGGYEDDVDNGYEFTYTGSGGRDLSGNKRTAEQSCDQTLTRENKALARNCAVNIISEEGADAGEDWRKGKPVRVVRSYKMLKHFPKYAPKEGIRYDGIYKVVKYYPEQGLSGYRVWKYLLRRDDPNPAPWEKGAKQYPIIYPDGYLEAEEEKKSLKKDNKKDKDTKRKGKKRVLHESNDSSDTEVSASKKRKTDVSMQKQNTNQKKGLKLSPVITKFLRKTFEAVSKEEPKSVLSVEEKTCIDADTINSKYWSECLAVCETDGKQNFIDHVTQTFSCVICKDLTASPVTTPCYHNFCESCLKQAYKNTASYFHCPCCRHNLEDFEISINEHLRSALRCILPGYDAKKK